MENQWELEAICWYYETGKSKADYVKKEYIHLLLLKDISSLACLSKLFKYDFSITV